MRILESRGGVIPGNYDPVNLAVSYYFVMLCVYTSFNSILPGIVMIAAQMLFYALTLNAWSNITRSLNYRHIAFIFLATIVFIVSFFFAKDENVFGQVGLTLIRWCIPLFFLGAAIRNVDDLEEKIKVASILILGFTYISIFVTKSSGNVVEAYSQDVGYQSSIPFVIFLSDYLIKRKIGDLIGAVLAFFAVLMGGARGPLLCIAIAFFMLWICFGKFDGKSSVVSFVVLVVFSILALVFYQDVLLMLISLFEKFGVSTRILMGLVENSIADDSSRSTLRNFALDYAKQHILLGTGVINDRKLIYDNITITSNKTVYGYYCHNFFFENLMQFGLVPGVIICAIWLKTIFSPMRRFNPNTLIIVATVMVAAGFLPLLVSYSYTTYQYFFLLIGFAFSYKNILMRYEASLGGKTNNAQTNRLAR